MKKPARRKQVRFGVACPSCGSPDTSVAYTRPTTEGDIKRCRDCAGCGRRFVTMERVECRVNRPESRSVSK